MSKKTKKLLVISLIVIAVAVLVYWLYNKYYANGSGSNSSPGSGGGSGGGSVDTRPCATEYKGTYTDIDSDSDPFLRLGVKGNKVRELQAKLNEIEDGYFGKCTESALRNKTGNLTIRYSKVKDL
jgi:hypothetical protein